MTVIRMHRDIPAPLDDIARRNEGDYYDSRSKRESVEVGAWCFVVLAVAIALAGWWEIGRMVARWVVGMMA